MKALVAIANTALSLAVFFTLNYAVLDSAHGNPADISLVNPAIVQIDKKAELKTDSDFATDIEDNSLQVDSHAAVKAPDPDAAAAATAPTEDTEQNSNTTAAAARGALPAPTATYYNMLDVNGQKVSYAESYNTTTAPSYGAGIWKGNPSTTDGSWCYFIGHNPGSFNCVANLYQGAPVTVWDTTGASRTYYVQQIFDVPTNTYWEQIAPAVTGFGESVILQTCIGTTAYRVVIAV